MRKVEYGETLKIWLSDKDTYNWAHRPGRAWPCSWLSGKRVFAEYYKDDLVDMSINGRMEDCDGNEFDAIMRDFIFKKS